MAIIIPLPIPPHPPAPSRDDPLTFEERNNAAVEYQFDTLPPAINQVAQSAYQNALETVSTAQIAQSSANYRGVWSDLSGPLSIPASVYDDGFFWILLEDIPDVSLSKPGDENPEWAKSQLPAIEMFEIGDFRDSLRVLDSSYLRRDGTAYSSADYPELAALLPPLPLNFLWSAFSPSGLIPNIKGISRMSSGNLAVATLTQFQKSEDWESMDPPVSLVGGRFALTAMSEEIGNVVVVVLSGGVLPGSSFVTDFFYSTDGGQSFTKSSTTTNFITLDLVVFKGAFVALSAADGAVYKTVSGATWTRYPNQMAQGVAEVTRGGLCVAGDRIYAVGYSNFLVYSDDAETWTRATGAPSSNAFMDLCYVNGWFIAIENSGRILRTQNFESGPWEEVRGNGGSLKSINNNGDIIVATGSISVMSSDNGASWRQVDDGQTGLQYEIFPKTGSVSEFVSRTVDGAIMSGGIPDNPLFVVPNDNPLRGWIKAL